MEEGPRWSRVSSVMLRVAWCVACVALICASVGPRELRAQDESEVLLVELGDDWTYYKGVDEPDSEWYLPTFDDRDWDIGPSPFGYGDTVGGTQLSDMQNNYRSVYIRRLFVVDEPESIVGLVLRIKYDDGVVVYLNGEEIARLSMPGNPGDFVPFDTAGLDHEASAPQVVPLACEHLALLGQGENVLAIQGHNVNLDSSDLVIEPELIGGTAVCPTEMTTEERTTGVRVRWTRPSTYVRYDFLELHRNGVLLTESPTRTSFTDRDAVPGENVYTLKVGVCDAFCEMEASITLGGGDPVFRRGDVDSNASVNLNDAIVILNSLFKGAGAPACLDAADTNDDGTFNLSDGIFLLGSLFQGQAQPPDPGTDTCGADPSEDELAECEYAAACE